MAYTAFEAMRQINRQRYGEDLGPMQPPVNQGEKENDLKSAALRFLRDRCEGLRHDKNIEAREKVGSVYEGTSLSVSQIPYNMQMDVDRLCLEKTLSDFIDSGTVEDAYSVYFCYINMFLGAYGESKKMVELLSEYEVNGSSLLMKHRDHYSHSVYVFALGLAIYETNGDYREAFRTFYSEQVSDEREAANMFLEIWGLTALFHDIGYPFELPFEQVLSYFEVNNQKRGKDSVYLAYRGIDRLVALDGPARKHFATLYGVEFDTITQLLAWDIAKKLGEDYSVTAEGLREMIDAKPVLPESFGMFMDHAFFSATRLYRELTRLETASGLRTEQVDALSAILLHNSLFKFAIAFYKDPVKCKGPLSARQHPLAYLLMICDELQCWDRTAYGRNSRTELHPMDAKFDFSGDAIHVIYVYDSAEEQKIDAFHEAYAAWEEDGGQGDPPRLKAYSDMVGKEQRFTRDIEKIINTSIMPLTVQVKLEETNRSRKHTYLSNSNFLHFYDLAVVLHGRNMPVDSTVADMEKKFTSHSLEYQLSTLNRARHFARYLDAIRCFYTDKPVDYDMVNKFTPAHTAKLAPMEHERWVREHIAMGWRKGDEYEKLTENLPEPEQKVACAALREQLRRHKLTMDGCPTEEEIADHYRGLDEVDQDKDWKPFNRMLQLLKKYDGTRIYSLEIMEK